MPAKKKPFRTIKDSYKTGRFSREEVRAAWIAVLRERGRLPPAEPEPQGQVASAGSTRDETRPAS